MHLDGSRVALSQFLASCDRVWAGELGPGPLGPPAGGAPAPLAADGPLFRTGARSIPAYSSYRWGVVLDPLPPGTTLTATGRTGVVDGDAWLEVSSDGVPPRTVWVLRADLAAEPGETGAYLNPEESASLLMHAEPKPDAPVVGVIPPRGTGILDMGQRQGDWVLVRFGSGEGWVAHARLRPLLDPPPMVAAPGQPPAQAAAPAPPEPYAQDHGAWHVDCDPCRAPAEGATCRIATESVATVRSRGTLTLDAPEVPVPGTVVDERRPPLGPAGRYRTGFAMPGPNDGGSLSLAIDGADPIRPPVWALDPSGEAAVILPSTIEPLLDALRSGRLVTVTVADGTRSWADSFDLAGFAAAYADMTGRLPFPVLYFDAAACPAAQPAPAGDAEPAPGEDNASPS
jgi:invasion protein IalB